LFGVHVADTRRVLKKGDLLAGGPKGLKTSSQPWNKGHKRLSDNKGVVGELLWGNNQKRFKKGTGGQ